MRPKKRKPLTREEVRDQKEADRKKKEAEALEVWRARQKRQRAREKDKPRHRRLRPESPGPSGIPEYGEGDPRPGWFTDKDWKKGRSRYDGN